MAASNAQCGDMHHDETAIIILASIGMSFAWPLLRRTYPGLLLVASGVSQLHHLGLFCAEFLVLGLLYAILRARKNALVNPLITRRVLIGCVIGFLFVGIALFADTFSSWQTIIGTLGFIGLAFASPVLWVLWFFVLIRLKPSHALTAVSISFCLSFLVSLTTLFNNPLQSIVLAIYPICSAILWYVIDNMIRHTKTQHTMVIINNDISSFSLTDNKNSAKPLVIPRELVMLLALFIIVGGVLRGVSNPEGAAFIPSEDISGILFRNFAGLIAALILTVGLRVGSYSIRSIVSGIIGTCLLFITGLVMASLQQDQLVENGLSLVTVACNCLEYLLFIAVLLNAACYKNVSSICITKFIIQFLIPALSSQFISYLVVPAIFNVFGIDAAAYAYLFAMGSALLLVLGMFGALTYMLLHSSRQNGSNRDDFNKIGTSNYQLLETKALGTLDFSCFGLTDRECDIALLLSQGYSYKKIAEILNITVSTVQSHVRSIYHKCSVNSRQEFIDLTKTLTTK